MCVCVCVCVYICISYSTGDYLIQTYLTVFQVFFILLLNQWVLLNIFFRTAKMQERKTKHAIILEAQVWIWHIITSISSLLYWSKQIQGLIPDANCGGNNSFILRKNYKIMSKLTEKGTLEKKITYKLFHIHLSCPSSGMKYIKLCSKYSPSSTLECAVFMGKASFIAL